MFWFHVDKILWESNDEISNFILEEESMAHRIQTNCLYLMITTVTIWCYGLFMITNYHFCEVHFFVYVETLSSKCMLFNKEMIFFGLCTIKHLRKLSPFWFQASNISFNPNSVARMQLVVSLECEVINVGRHFMNSCSTHNEHRIAHQVFEVSVKCTVTCLVVQQTWSTNSALKKACVPYFCHVWDVLDSFKQGAWSPNAAIYIP